MKLIERDILTRMRRFLSTPDVVVLHGARQVGKTSALRLLQEEIDRAGKPTQFIDLEDLRMLSLLDEGADPLLAFLDERGLLKRGKLHLFVDEIQYLKNPSNLLKVLRDHHADRLKVFVSGSSSFDIKSKFKDSLAGRTVNFELLPLSFREFLRFKGSDIDMSRRVTSESLIRRLKELFTEYVLYGAYPRVVLEKEIGIKEAYLAQVIATYIRKDIRDLANIREVDKFNRLIEALAAQSGQLLNVLELAGTTRLSRPTVEQYLFLLEATYVIRLVRPFSKNVRAELFKTPKVFFLDTGVAQLLWLKAFQRTILGGMLETAVYGELLKNHPDAQIHYWRTQDGKEVDFILRGGQSVLPIEVKVNARHLNLTAIRFFQQHYKVKEGLCLALDMSAGRVGGVVFRYPWEEDA